jgi:hypothetical protein
MVTITLGVSTNQKAARAEQNSGGSPPGVVVALSTSVTSYGINGPGASARGSLALENGTTDGAVLSVVPGTCEIGWGNTGGAGADWGGTGWTVEGRLIALRGDAATIDLRWRRNFGVLQSDDTPAEWQDTVTLREDEKMPFDMVRAPTDSSSPCQWYVAQVGVQLLDPPEVAGAALRYEMWLVHHDKNGRESTDRLQLAGDQAAVVKYTFKPLRISRGGSLVEAADEASSDVTVSGGVRGRARTDGLIDLTVETWRSIRYPVGISGRGGTKQLTVRPNETVEVGLPPEYGVFKFPETGEVVDLDKLFAGHATAIRLTTTRVR